MQDNDLWVSETDHHPNELAHRLAAEAIEQFLERTGLLKMDHSAPAAIVRNRQSP
jgi:hypothetical protein